MPKTVSMNCHEVQRYKCLITDVTIFHLPDVRPQPAICWRQGRCKFVIKFIEHHCKEREVVVLHQNNQTQSVKN